MTGDRRFDAALVVALGAVLGLAVLAEPPANIDLHKAYDAVAREILRTGSFHYSYPSLKNLPIVAALFVPLASLPRDLTDVCFLGIEIAAYLVAFALCLSRLARTRREKWLLLLLFGASRPLYVSIDLGQLTVPCFSLLVATLVALLRDRQRWAGVAASLAFVLKIPAGLMMAWFLLRGRMQSLVAALITFASLLAISLLVFGVSLHRDYVDWVIVKNSGSTLTAANNASVAATGMRIVRASAAHDAGDLTNWRMIAIPPAGNVLLAAGSLALLGWLAVTLRRRGKNGEDALCLEFCMVICAGLILPPVVWDHYFVFLALPLFVTARGLDDHPLRIATWLCALLLLNLPVGMLTESAALAGSDALRVLRAAIPAAPLLSASLLLGLSSQQHRGIVS